MNQYQPNLGSGLTGEGESLSDKDARLRWMALQEEQAMLQNNALRQKSAYDFANVGQPEIGNPQQGYRTVMEQEGNIMRSLLGNQALVDADKSPAYMTARTNYDAAMKQLMGNRAPSTPTGDRPSNYGPIMFSEGANAPIQPMAQSNFDVPLPAQARPQVEVTPKPSAYDVPMPPPSQDRPAPVSSVPYGPEPPPSSWYGIPAAAFNMLGAEAPEPREMPSIVPESMSNMLGFGGKQTPAPVQRPIAAPVAAGAAGGQFTPQQEQTIMENMKAYGKPRDVVIAQLRAKRLL